MSEVRQYAFKILNAFDGLAQAHIKTPWTNKIWNAVKWYVVNRIFPKKTDAELKKDLEIIYNVLKPLFEQIQSAHMIKEGENLGSPKIPRTPNIKKIMDLVEGL